MLESLFNKAAGFASELMQYCKLKGRFTSPHCFYLLMKMKYFDVRELFLRIQKKFNALLRGKVRHASQNIIIINFKHILVVEPLRFSTSFILVQCRHY